MRVLNILFLTLLDFESIEEHNIYTDLLREFIKHKHEIYTISPIERRKNLDSYLIKEENATILKLKIGNIQKTSLIEKGISTLTIEPLFIKGIKKNFSNIKFDFVIYSTPPITFCKAIEFVKKRDGAKTYLMLKDIFPQNAIDMGMLKKRGIKGLIYKYFRNKEKKLYSISDTIGCMSQGNVDYVIRHNLEVDSEKFEICPNCVEAIDIKISKEERTKIRNKYEIPIDKTIFLYGGNLGKPQSIDFLVGCLESQKKNNKVFFLIIGDGTEYKKIQTYVEKFKPQNVKLMKYLSKEDYDRMARSCDVGMIFLDYRFTIPNFPSRLLSYMQAEIPVLAVTDPNTDIGKVIVDGNFGWWCKSNSIEEFGKRVDEILKCNLKEYGVFSKRYLNDNYTVECCYNIMSMHL